MQRDRRVDYVGAAPRREDRQDASFASEADERAEGRWFESAGDVRVRGLDRRVRRLDRVGHVHDAVATPADHVAQLVHEFGVRGAQQFNGLVDVVFDIDELVLSHQVASPLRHEGEGHDARAGRPRERKTRR
jgi:hypothetical protein